MIEAGYLLQPPKRRLKHLLKVRKEEEETLAKGEIPKVTFRVKKLGKDTESKKRKADEDIVPPTGEKR